LYSSDQASTHVDSRRTIVAHTLYMSLSKPSACPQIDQHHSSPPGQTRPRSPASAYRLHQSHSIMHARAVQSIRRNNTQFRKGAPGPAVVVQRSSISSSSQENKEPKHQYSICHTNQLLSQNARSVGAGSKRKMPQSQDLFSPCLTSSTTRVTTCQSRT
jgi:hypothetical protein